MEIQIIPGAKTRFSGIEIFHRDEKIVFRGQGTLYGGDNETNLFDSTNDYLDALPIEVKEDLFDCYVDAKMILDPSTDSQGNPPPEELMVNNHHYHFLINKLRPIIEKVLKLINPINYEYYLVQNGFTDPPNNLEVFYNRGEFPSETTIDNTSYTNLAKFTLLLRPVFPIINEMIAKAEEIAGKDYKEVVAVHLITEIPSLTSHPGWRKLVEYVDYSYNERGKPMNPLRLDIISEDRYVDHAVAKALLSRLCVSHIPSLIPGRNLAKSLFSVVRQLDAGQSQVRDKKPNNFDESGQKRGVYEIYQLKENVNGAEEMAQAEFFSFGLMDEEDRPRHTNRFKHQCIGLGITHEALVEDAYDLIPEAWDFQACPHAFKLVQLAFIDDISYNNIYALEYPQLMAALALAQVKLHEMGFPSLAVLVTAIPDPAGLRTETGTLFNLDSTERQRIEALCDVVKGRGEISTDNEAVADVMDFFNDLGRYPWVSTIEYGLLADPKALKTAIRGQLFEVELIKEIKTEFLDLVVRVNTPE